MDTFKRVRNRACKSRCLGKNGYKRAVWSRVLLGKISNVPCTSCFQPSPWCFGTLVARWRFPTSAPHSLPQTSALPRVDQLHCAVSVCFLVRVAFVACNASIVPGQGGGGGEDPDNRDRLLPGSSDQRRGWRQRDRNRQHSLEGACASLRLFLSQGSVARQQCAWFARTRVSVTLTFCFVIGNSTGLLKIS